jgi:LysR family transcriptional regulator, cys regulon transcriptional activator
MNFHQLQYALAVAKNGLSVTNAAAALGTSQPAISRALKELEKELGFDLFVREGRSFARVTPEGTKVLEYASRALAEIESLRAVAADLNQDSRGVLSIATTHTQARYVLPPVVQAFRKRYPEVDLHLHQGTSEQISEMVASDRVHLAIATGSEALFPELVLLPVYRWHRQVIVPKTHPLARAGAPKLTLAALGEISAGDVCLQLQWTFLAGKPVCQGGPETTSGADRPRFRCDQDLCSSGHGRGHRGQCCL